MVEISKSVWEALAFGNKAFHWQLEC